MKTEDLILVGGIGIAAYYFMQKKGTAAAAGGFQFTVPQAPAIPSTRFNPVPPADSTLSSGYQAGAALVGDSLSAMTGIPGFGDVGKKLASLIGQGRRQADDLVQHYQNPMLLGIGGDLINQWHIALNTGRATQAVKEALKQMLAQLVANFVSIASEPQFNRAGAGGIATANHILNDVWLPNIELEFQQQGVL